MLKRKNTKIYCIEKYNSLKYHFDNHILHKILIVLKYSFSSHVLYIKLFLINHPFLHIQQVLANFTLLISKMAPYYTSIFRLRINLILYK